MGFMLSFMKYPGLVEDWAVLKGSSATFADRALPLFRAFRVSVINQPRRLVASIVFRCDPDTTLKPLLGTTKQSSAPSWPQNLVLCESRGKTQQEKTCGTKARYPASHVFLITPFMPRAFLSTFPAAGAVAFSPGRSQPLPKVCHACLRHSFERLRVWHCSRSRGRGGRPQKNAGKNLHRSVRCRSVRGSTNASLDPGCAKLIR